MQACRLVYDYSRKVFYRKYLVEELGIKGKTNFFTQTTGIGYFSYTFVRILTQLHCKFRFNGASTLTYQNDP